MKAPVSVAGAMLAGLFAFAPLPVLSQDHPEAIHVHDAYARIGPSSGAVFFMVHNNTATDVVLVGAHSEVAKLAQLHSHSEGADGVMQMGMIEGGVSIGSGEMHEFARGGDHVMLMGLTRKLSDGDRFDLVLDFADGTEVTVPVIVDNERKADAMGDMPMDMTDHSHHGTSN